MIIAVGTENKAKNKGVSRAVLQVWPDAQFESYSVDSGVADQPHSEEETIKGAINRAQAVLKKSEQATYGVGLEGGLTTNQYGMFLMGWVAIVDRNGTIGLGASAHVRLPDDFQKALEQGRELGEYTRERFADSGNEIRHSNGTFGILTNDLCTRVDQFSDATKSALAIFLKPELYS